VKHRLRMTNGNVKDFSGYGKNTTLWSDKAFVCFPLFPHKKWLPPVESCQVRIVVLQTQRSIASWPRAYMFSDG